MNPLDFENFDEEPEESSRNSDSFDDRIHVIAASAMMSHGVDIDRLNVLVIMGVPLTTAEFIQTTSRVGRTHPGLVIVLHKIGRERDAAVYRNFPSFVGHADRLHLQQHGDPLSYLGAQSHRQEIGQSHGRG